MCFPAFLDDETRLGQLREVRVGQERAETDLQEGAQQRHLWEYAMGWYDRGWTGHPVYHGLGGRVQDGAELDRQ